MGDMVPLAVRAAAALRLRERARARAVSTNPEATAASLRYGDWLAIARPEWSWRARHFLAMQRILDDAVAGIIRRIYFQIPIRHGKSEHNTIGFGAYLLERNPRLRLLVCSYNQAQANTFSRDMRKLARARGVALSVERDAVQEWDTAAGGRVRAVGAGTGVASVNADVILVDDPIGSREDAESRAERDRVWDWLTNDILARGEADTIVVMTMSRWHQDDPAGRLRERFRDRWTVLDLPARAEADDPLGRAPNEPLWPEVRTSEWLDEKEDELTSYGFASLMQGRPRPREGGMFKWDWWQLLDAVPSVGPMVRYWDLAGTEPECGRHDPDFSVGALACRMLDQRTALVDVARFRHSVAQRDAEVCAIAAADRAAYGSRVSWWIETEAGIAGTDRTASLVRKLHAMGLPVRTEHPTGSKVLRAEPLAAMAEAGNIVLCPGAWRDAFRAESVDFPNGKHDDQIDAAGGACAKLVVQHTSGFTTVRL